LFEIRLNHLYPRRNGGKIRWDGWKGNTSTGSKGQVEVEKVATRVRALWREAAKRNDHHAHDRARKM